MRRRRLLVVLAAVGVLLGSLLAPTNEPPAAAHNSPWGWWACTQRAKLANGPLKIGHANLPVDGSGDGVSNSFRNRLADATSRLNSALLANTPYSYGAVYVGQVPYYPGTAAHVVVRYESLEEGVLGRANVSPSCATVHGTRVDLANAISVQIAIRSDWFTQADSRRALWESCPASGYSPAYTCSKVFDFGSVMLHELGHAVGLAHPRQTDQHVNGTAPSTVMALADCAVVLDQATMCQAQDSAGSNQYRSHRRTFHSWDLQSIDAGY